MANFYTYLISSLPMLHFGAKPPFSYERFLKMCEGLISDKDVELLSCVILSPASSTLDPVYGKRGEEPNAPSKILRRAAFGVAPQNDTLQRWHAFDTALRNELVKIRASHKHIDPAKYMREDGCAEIYPHTKDFGVGVYIAHLAMNARRNPSVLEAEKTLDADRWRFLDELSLGHYFDIDILVIYALKLLILERWDKINTTDKAKILEEVLA